MRTPTMLYAPARACARAHFLAAVNARLARGERVAIGTGQGLVVVPPGFTVAWVEPHAVAVRGPDGAETLVAATKTPRA